MKSKMSHRLLSVVLTVAIVFSMLPLSLAVRAATENHPDVVTVTVIDADTKEPIVGAEIDYIIANVDTGEDVASGTDVLTDENGEAELYNSAEIGNLQIRSITVAHDDYALYENAEYNQEITDLQDNFTVKMTSIVMKDVKVVGKDLTYNGTAQFLVEEVTAAKDEIYYLNGELVNSRPSATDAGTYSVRVVVIREGFKTVDETVEVVIKPAPIEGIKLSEKTGLEYNGEEQELVSVKGIPENSTVTWTVNGNLWDKGGLPMASAAGLHEVTLTVDRGSNYEVYENTVTTEIALGDMVFEDLDITIRPNEGLIYNTTEQELLTVVNPSDCTLQYSVDEQATWTSDIPKAIDANDEYKIYVKLTKRGYKDKVLEYVTKIAKASQEIEFESVPKDETLSDNVPYQDKTYKFKAVAVQNYTGGTITYELVETDEGETARIDADGILTVQYPGAYTVRATLPGNENYEECFVEHTLSVYGNGQYVFFDEGLEVNYILGTSNGVVSTARAEKTNRYVGSITYAIVYPEIEGVSKFGLALASNGIEAGDGKITVSDYDALAKAIREAGGELALTVTATNNPKSNSKYTSSTASYPLRITFADAPENPYTLSAENEPVNGWYTGPVTVAPAEEKAGGGEETGEEATGEEATTEEEADSRYTIAKHAGDTFSDTVCFDDEGTHLRYVYLRNKETGGITARIPIENNGEIVKIDSCAPDHHDLTMEFSKPNNEIIETLGKWLGFYKPSVTVTFTAVDDISEIDKDYLSDGEKPQDAVSGVKGFNWTYTSVSGEEVTGYIDARYNADEANYTATLTLPINKEDQLHGTISFNAVDNALNVSDVKTSDGDTIIVDTVSPKLTVQYRGKDHYEDQNGEHEGKHFFNSDVEVTLNVEETHFYPADVIVTVTKNGEAFDDYGTIDWDQAVGTGTFTLHGDGDYVVSVSYTDKAGNKMDDYTSETIVVDTIPPEVSVEPIQDDQKIVFAVTEHNFRASDIMITGTIQDINGNVAFTAEELTHILHKAEWKADGDKYTFEYDEYVDGIYNLEMAYTDIAGLKADNATVSFIVDREAPTAPVIEYVTTPLDTFLNVITFGYYNPDVTVRFTSYDTSAGVTTFKWGYTKEEGASTINHPETLEDAEIEAIQSDENDRSKFTAEITLTADEAAQYRGHIHAKATDAHGNESDVKTDDGNVIVVDTVAPEMTVEYTQANYAVDGEYYYNGAVDVKFTVTEANFYPEDVVVTVTKNDEAFDFGTIVWSDRDEADQSVGTFTLAAPEDHSGDGHYVIALKYTDRSKNKTITYVSDTHTIDTTRPVIKVEYQNKKVVNVLMDQDGHERQYFADTQKAVVTITEHNFVSDDVIFDIVAKDVSGTELDQTALSSMNAWKVDSSGDVHTIVITYPGDANYTFDVAYTDQATNEAEDYIPDYFTVDKTAPENLTVAYSKGILDTVLEMLSFGFYNAKMTVTLTAEDVTSDVHAFLYSYVNADGVSDVNAELINEAIQVADIQYSGDRKTATATFEIPKAVLVNDNQFNGTVEFSATDRAGNKSGVHKETKRIVVDNIAPTAQVSFGVATNVEGDISYYNGDITATITVDEANFYAEDVKVTVSKDGGAATAVTPAWTHNNVDVHVGTFTLTEDGDYIVTINYTDKSSNKMMTYTSKQMTIDTQIEAPTYTINDQPKTKIGGAYKGEARIGFSFADQNFDTKSIQLTRTRFDKVEDVTETFITVDEHSKGGSGSFEIPAEEGNDGIYVLKIAMTDKAKHETEAEMKFTINRYGSVYEYSDELVALIKDGGQHVQAVEKDLVITEYNADKILEDSLQILVTCDGKTEAVKFTSDPKKIDDKVTVGERGWYQYTYTVKASNFEKDGLYKITLTSKYATDDSAENESTSVPENSVDEQSKEILDTMSFTVDTVSPEIRNIINLDKRIADRKKIVDGKLNVKYTIIDVGGLKTIEIIVNGNTVQTLTEEDIAENVYNFSGSFDLDEQIGTKAHKVRIRVTDLAGNVTDTDSEEFRKVHSENNDDSTYVFFGEVTVSRNFFVRWYANKVLFWGSIGGVVVLAAAVCFIVAAKKKKKEEK